jgi:O-antigen ligase
VRDVGINVAGRVEAWDLVVRSARESRIVGKGIGSSNVLLMSHFVGGSFDHPHNDYLRVWHDLGLIGLGLLLFALFSWASILAREWYHAERQGKPAACTELAGLLALLALMLAMVTDNPIVSTYIMAPTGILVGAGLGTVAARRALPRASIYRQERMKAR